MKFLILISLIILSQPSWAIESVNQQINSSLSLLSPNGESMQLERHNYIRLDGDPVKNLSTWYQNVQVVDDDGQAVSDEKYKVSQKYLFKSISDEIETSLPLIDTKKGLQFRSPEGTRYVVLGKEKGRKEHYLVVMVNAEGEVISKKGEPLTQIDGNSIYKIEAGTYEEAVLKSKLGTLVSLQFDFPNWYRPPSGKCISTQTDKNSERPESRTGRKPAGVVNTDPSKSPYKKLMDIRNSIKGKKSCQNEMRKKSEELLQNTEWAGLNIEQRASKISNLSKDVVTEIKKDKVKASGNFSRDLFNPNVIHPLITPALLSCISYQETRGLLNPINMNYTYCNNTKGMVSTAHGLHHVVRKTLTWLKTHVEGDQIPLTSKYSSPFSDLSPRELHEASSSSAEVQLEIMLRVMNFNIKHIDWKNKGKLKGNALLKKAIVAYDQDSQSQYISNVLDRCLPCMNSIKSSNEAPGCYEKLK